MTASVGALRPRNWGLALAAPNLTYLTLVLLVPLGILVTYSLFTSTAIGIPQPVLTTANYAKLLDGYYVNLLLRTGRIALQTTLICAVLAYPLAYFLARASRRVALIGLFLLLTPLMVSAVVRAFGWLVIFGRRGAINSLFDALGIEEGPQILYTEAAVLVGLVHLLLPFMVLPLMASIERIPLSVEEAARSLGANDVQVFVKVILPLSTSGLISGALLVYVEAASAFVLPALLGGRRVRMVGNEVYDLILTAFNWPFAAALTVSILAITLVAVGAVLRLARRGKGRN